VLLRQIQGYIAHNKHFLPQDPAVALCLGTYGDPMGMGISYERGTPDPCASSQLDPWLVRDRACTR